MPTSPPPCTPGPTGHAGCGSWTCASSPTPGSRCGANLPRPNAPTSPNANCTTPAPPTQHPPSLSRAHRKDPAARASKEPLVGDAGQGRVGGAAAKAVVLGPEVEAALVPPLGLVDPAAREARLSPSPVWQAPIAAGGRHCQPCGRCRDDARARPLAESGRSTALRDTVHDTRSCRLASVRVAMDVGAVAGAAGGGLGLSGGTAL